MQLGHRVIRVTRVWPVLVFFSAIFVLSLYTIVAPIPTDIFLFREYLYSIRFPWMLWHALLLTYIYVYEHLTVILFTMYSHPSVI